MQPFFKRDFSIELREAFSVRWRRLISGIIGEKKRGYADQQVVQNENW
jgi:hypothetical protein